MKAKHLLVILGLLLLNSCIVKSLNPFYTKDKVVYEKKLEGNWKGKNSTWKIMSLENAIREDYKKNKKHNRLKSFENDDFKFSKEDLEIIEKFKDAYYIENSKYGKEAIFIATPFKIGKHLFLDFTPFEYETENLNNLAAQHLLKTHSVCLVEFSKTHDVKLKWLDEEVLKTLINENNLKIKHEKTGFDDDLILTASSKELYRFLEKFMSSDIEKKWEKDQIYTLVKTIQ